jgi:hypothetical protein
MKPENKELVIDFLTSQNLDIDFAHHLGHNSFDSFDEIRDILDNNNAFQVEIIYYSTAIEYLQKNDPSLRESLGLASEMGFSMDKLNSEILASLLASENVRSEFEELESEVSDLIAELLEQEESEEAANY